MTDFNPIKAAAEQLSGMEDSFKVLNVMVRSAEQRASEAEVQLNALLKVRAVFSAEIEKRQTDLAALRAAKDQADREGSTS